MAIRFPIKTQCGIHTLTISDVYFQNNDKFGDMLSIAISDFSRRI